ncbi:MAG: phosphoribosylformylglycinamidine cyclo-ligase [bacterium]|nr:phosphoribosylformylglycinamidine cyclo-ligase [bacterium]
MSTNQPASYRDAGVDTQAGRAFVKRITSAVESTHGPNVLKDASGFGGLFSASFVKDYDDPVLVSSTDGVGTKLHLALLFDRHETIGQDLVAMCVNDLLATGARPLFFMDYIACGKLNPDRMTTIVESISAGCREAGAALVGGETAEHPDTMRPGEYDLGGFTVGVVEKSRIFDSANVRAGDVLIGVPSSGVHSNGMSLVRRVFLKGGLELPESQDDRDFLRDQVLLRPTVIYEQILRPVLEDSELRSGVRAMAHITGGGFYENIPRIIPEDLIARVERSAWTPPPVFDRIQERGSIVDKEMFSVFNMGIGLVLAVAPERADAVLSELERGFVEWNARQDEYRRIEGDARPVVLGQVIERQRELHGDEEIYLQS